MLLTVLGALWRRIAANVTISVAMKASPQDRPPHEEFLLRNAGTLPELITEVDLETLNSGLRFLFAHLRDARQQFENEPDGGRSAAITALGGVWRFILLFKEPRAECLHMPVLDLQGALAALSENLVLPILKPVPRSGRAPSSHVHAAVIGWAAGAVQRLMRKGFSRTESCKAVAAQLRKDGVQPERGAGKVTADTVRHWCANVASDIGGHELPARLCRLNLSETEDSDSTSPRDDVRRDVLASLSACVREITLANPKAT
jgi:hypothetical protein